MSQTICGGCSCGYKGNKKTLTYYNKNKCGLSVRTKNKDVYEYYHIDDKQIIEDFRKIFKQFFVDFKKKTNEKFSFQNDAPICKLNNKKYVFVLMDEDKLLNIDKTVLNWHTKNVKYILICHNNNFYLKTEIEEIFMENKIFNNITENQLHDLINSVKVN